ncbi:hypothetical protein B0H17DRAFT_833546, partial [Mycena rosella]
IPKCGAKIADALAKHGAGRDLRQILISFAGVLRDQHLAAWRNGIRTELQTNSSGFLARCHPKLAEDIPNSFPDMCVVDLYINSLTSWSPQFLGNPPDVALWVPREPVIHEISTFCREHLGWNTPDVLNKRFFSVLWPGVAFRMISSRHVMYNRTTKTFVTPSTNERLVKIVKQSSPDKGTPTLDMMRIRISFRNF